MATIKLMNGENAIVDDNDYEFLSKYKWEKHNAGYAYTRIYLGYENGKPKRKYVLMHRMLLDDPKGKEIDHADGNRLNNSRENIRVCTHKENMRNRKQNNTNRLGVKGVSKRGNKYRSVIKCEGKRYFLGSFDALEEAAKAYNKAASFYFGDFAKLNAV